MKFLLSLLFVLTSLQSYATNPIIEADIQDLLFEIEDYIAGEDVDNKTLIDVKSRLKKVMGVLKGQVGVSGAFKCVAKDNDDADPWMIGVRKGAAITKLANSVLGSKNNCKKSLKAAVRVRRSHLFCGSKDNDGRSPFTVIAHKPGMNVLMARALGKTVDECTTALGFSKTNGMGAYLCVSKDNDSSRPYVLAFYNSKTHNFEYGQNTFSKLSDCLDDI